ncbi:MAG: hypothetical protein JNM03_10535 [Sphingopyxis sp.]|uniref:hypothetical protein n=1 Tax=Sphingopyxis sp. TaxID=1908224 RepID=UPI001A5213F5|nr:hypothetical protein [Sphingopyxis sp.]MBL9070414.1 hypothetical protein [Sphingopyxis sp.]
MAATDTAGTKVAAKIKQVLVAATTAQSRTFKWFTSQDRTDMDPLAEGEIPGGIIGVAKVDFAFSEMQGQMRHEAQIIISCQSGIETGLSIDPGNQDMMAFAVETLATSNDLGGMVEDLIPVSADASEQSAPDVGEALLILACTFYTPTNDFRTIIGGGGATF